MTAPYDADFYRRHAAASARSAAVVVPLVAELLRPRRVADVGCGTGEWLAAFVALGIDDVTGFEGPWIAEAPLAVPRERIRVVDLDGELSAGRSIEGRYDLTLCLEVAEHLDRTRANALVAALVAAAPAVLFSAAIPGQGGTGHLNEESQSAWAARFAAHGHVPLDAVRPRVWSDPEVAWWYAQNTLLYLAEERLAEDPGLLRRAATQVPLDLVHPRAFALKVEEASALDPEHASLRGALRRLPRIVAHALRRRLGGLHRRD